MFTYEGTKSHNNCYKKNQTKTKAIFRFVDLLAHHLYGEIILIHINEFTYCFFLTHI